ncbi:flagellin hook IN motif-containing protein [Micavibrio aeruginosavorus]|uniref:Flagellar hook-associated protein FliD n=1 Tax=Micavibrio aeruginosavorus EPB TaxID=349215 RepID=M4VDT2_9BACT|nr:flagellin hook IN motif-containing protein [Micavibrio aeruginosavorus]AGH97512.1 Flagellar hook-associated protein FliD [Micavibrio aeruginosavorus EPB]
MTSDVVLSAAMRTNLLSLQSTQNSIDLTQRNLGTGKKINSALDGPQAFFASRALTNRAADLTKLLDSIGQSVQVIKAADTGVTALTSLVEQADSIASQAQEALAAGTAEAKVTGNKDLRNIDDLTDVPGLTGGVTLTLTATDADGDVIDPDPAGGAQTSITVAVAAGTSTNELITAINEIRDQADQSAVFEAKLDDKGQLSIRSLVSGGSFTVDFSGATDADKLAAANALGFGEIAKVTADGIAAAPNNVGFTATADVALKSYNFVKNDQGDVADRSTLLTALRTAEAPTAATLFDGISGENYTIAVNGGAAQNIALAATATVQEFVDAINNNSTLSSKLEATFDEGTGQISIRAIDASVESVQIGFAGSAIGDSANFGFGLTDLSAVAAGVAVEENIQLGSSAGQLAKLEQDFNKIRDQIDALVSNGDTGYRGTNLLNGNDLLTTFNEDRTSTIETKGVTFTSAGLGLEEANFSNAASVDGVISAVRDALGSVRDFGATLANDLSVIQTRQTFTTSLINTLKEGSDKLVNADQNEEGAKLLALQTRQSLGVTALSLASQSQQSILRLF